MNKNNLRLIYLAGYGRSGQTLIESILHCQDGIEVLGAITNLPEKLNSTCSCGQLLIKCPFWSEIWKDFLKEVNLSVDDFFKLQRRVEGIGPYKNIFLDFQHRQSVLQLYTYSTKLFYETIWKHVPRETLYLVDASKTAYITAKKPLELYKILGNHLKIIHLVRDLRGVMWSFYNKGIYRNRSDRAILTYLRFSPIRALIGWKFANHYAAAQGRILTQENYLRLRYEELMSSPAESLLKIGTFLDMDFSGLVDKVATGLDQRNKHSVMGNPMRFQKKIWLKPDMDWQQRLPVRYRTLCKLFAGKQMAAYGYMAD